ncbi:MAG: HepT-like ribonuclease domain-containing protein [Pseudomonadota bacterium]
MSSRTDILYITDIRESIEAILLYTKGISFDALISDRMRYSVVIREFEIIGEAVGKLPDDLKTNISRLIGKISKTSAIY